MGNVRMGAMVDRQSVGSHDLLPPHIRHVSVQD
jgi:hypothetical protein